MFEQLEANELARYEPHGGAEGTEATGGKRGTSAAVVGRGEKPLIVSSSTLPDDFFAEQALLATCTLGNNSEIETTALLDTRATGYSFVDPSMARCVCDKLHIEPVRLSKPKAFRGFDGKPAPNVTHAIYPTMTILDYKETTTPMLITKLGQHQIILGKPWIKKHGVILDMQNDWLSF